MTEHNFHIDSAAVSDRGLSEKRPQNEDSFLELAGRGVFAVADGVGGAQAGDVASQMAVEIIGEAFANARPNSDAEEVMKAAIDQANSAIFQMSHDLAQLSTMATTVVALHVAGNIATIGHVGDSRLYRLDGHGNLYRETQDHSVVEEEVRAGRMTQEQAANHPSRNVISRALGAESTVEIDMKTIMFEPSASFLLCSDGITRHIEDNEIRNLLAFGGTPTEICEQMKSICYERGAEDNLTAVIVRIGTEAAVAPEVSDDVPDEEERTIATARVLPETEEFEAPEEDFDGDETQEIKPKPVVPKMETSGGFENGEEKVESVAYVAEEKRDDGFAGKIFSSALLLLVGIILGAGIYYFLMGNTKQPEVPQIAPQSSNPLFTIFEEGRRTVDAEPEKYIAAHVGETNKNAEGHYLIGRAYLLTGKFGEAKKSFDEAKNHLAEVADVNSKVLSNEIDAGLAIVNSPVAANDFKKKMDERRSGAVPTNTEGNSPVKP